MNLKRVSIGDEIFIRRDFTVLNISCKHGLNLIVSFGVKRQPVDKDWKDNSIQSSYV